MATVHSVNITANLDAKNAQATAEKLHKTIKATKEEAASIPTGGGKALAAAYKGSTSQTQLTEYGQTRAMRPGGTGASARDFAQEAQGLGGLVRLYATYAANIYAVAAAFNALQAAQDTANMVKGLNQLGAASGVALGNLSKDLVKVTDGAVSLREAMEATVKASSSGMVSKDILRMGEVAKKASQALGINMQDALSRLSRGITKLEPELLDELGIFTRIDPAVQAYAKTVNKSVSELSQFERQMAFSNAVLQEGERKFGAINIETNAYTQLLAKLKDAATSIGDALNTVLVPIVKLLQSSPTALYTMIGALQLMVLKQAIPAFSNMRKAMLDNLTAMGELAEKKRDGLTKVMTDIATSARKQAEKAMEIPDDKFLAEQARLKKLTESMGLSGKLTQSFQALSPGITDIAETEKLIKKLEQQVKAETTKNSGKADVYNQMLTAAKAHYDQELKYQDKLKEADADALKRMQKTVEYKAIVRELQDVQNAQSKAFIVNAAQETARVEGLVAGHRRLTEEIKKRREASIEAGKAVKQGDLTQVGNTGFGKAASAAAYGTGLLSIAGAKLESVMGAMSPWLAVLALVQAALGILDGWLDTTAESAGKFTDALNQSKDATNTLSENIARLDTLKISEFFNQETIKGTQTAIIGVVDSVSTLAQRFEALKTAQKDSWWARMKDGIASMWGGDTQTKFTEGVAKQVTQLLKDLEKAPAKFKSTSDAIARLTGVSDPTNLTAMEKALKGIDPKSEKFKELQKILQQLKVDAGNLATDVQAFKTQLTEFGDATRALANQFVDKDPLTVFALKGLTASDKLQKTLKGELVGAVSAIGEALEDLGKKPLFGQDADIAQLGKMKVALESMQKALVDNEREIKDLTEQRAKVQKEINIDSFGNTSLDDAKIESLSKQIKLKQQQLAAARSKAPQLVAEIQELSTKGANSFLDILDAKIAVTMAKGGQAFMNAVAQALGNLPGVATMKADAQLADIGFQKELIKLQMQMLEQQTLSRINSDLLVQEAEIQRIKIRDPNNATGAVGVAEKKLDSMRMEKEKVQNTKDPRALLALSKDKQGETASALREFALAKAGMYSQLKQLDDQAAGINFTKKIEEAGARLEVEKRIIDLRKQDNNLSLQNIDLQEKLQGEISDQDVIKRSALLQENLKLDYTKEVQDNLARQNVLQMAINSGVANEKAKKAAQDEIDRLKQQLETSKGKLVADITMDEYNARMKILDNAKRENDFLVQKKELSESINKTIQETAIAQSEANIGIQKDFGVDTGAQDIQLQAMKDAEAFRAQAAATRLAQEKELFDLEQKRKAITDTGSTEYARIGEIITLTKQKYEAIIAGEQQSKDIQAARLATQEKILAVTREQELATVKVQSAAESLAAAFGTVGENIGNFISAFTEVTINREKAQAAEASQQEYINKLYKERAELDVFDPSYTEKQLDFTDKIAKAEKDLSHSKAKSAAQEESDNIRLLSIGKKMFSEKTAAYKILNGLEKAAHIAKLALAAKELAVKLGLISAETAGVVAGQAANTAANAAGTAARTSLNIPEMISKMWSQLGIFGPIGIALALASIAGAGGKTGGFVASQAQIQETQGTGQSYDSEGKLVSNGGGVLGDATAKNQDIGNQIDKLSKLTIDGNVIGLDMIVALEKIKYNTQQMAAGFFKVQGLTGGLSGFGTVEKSSPGLLGMFASSTSIIDTGIKFLAGKFQQYETVQKTNSGIFGFLGSTSIRDNTKALPTSLEDDINKLFADNVKVQAKALGSLTGLDSKKLETQITNAISKEGFKVSLKGLKSGEVSDAIMQVVSEAVGVPLREIAPFIDNFRQIGEGTVGTLIRLNAETTFVDKAFRAMGNPLKMLPKIATQATEEQIATAKAAADKVTLLTDKVSSLKDAAKATSSTGGEGGSSEERQALQAVTVAEEELAQARTELATAQTNLRLAETTNIQANIALTQSMIDNAGGIDKFVEQMDFFQSNFVDKIQTFRFGFEDLNETLAEVSSTYGIAGLQATTSREQFTALVQGLDLTTEAGRNTYQALMEVAPAVDAFQSKVEEYADIMSSAFFEAMENSSSPEAAGAYVAETISYSIQKTIYDQGVNAIMNVIANQIISPIIAAATTSATATQIIGKLQIDAVRAQVTTIASTLSALFKDEKFQALISEITTSVAGLTTTAAGILPVLPKKPTLDKVKDSQKDADDAAKSLAERLKELASAAKAQQDSLFSNLVSTLRNNANSIKGTITKLKDFTKSILEFKTNLLLGDKSTLTPAQKYIKAKADFETTYAKALAGDEDSIGKLQTVSDSFLQASQSFYASGDQYAADLQTVLSAIDTSVIAAGRAESIMETELKTINDQLLVLDGIELQLTNIKAVLEIGLSKTSDQILQFMAAKGETGIAYKAEDLLSRGLATTLKQAQLLIAGIDTNGDGAASFAELTSSRNIGANTLSTANAIVAPSTGTTAAANVAGTATHGADKIVKVGGENFVYSSAGALGMQTGSNWTLQLRDGTRITQDRAAELLKTEGAALFQSGQHEALYNVFKQAGLSSAAVSALSGISQQDLLGWAAANGLPAFDTGINYVPYDMPAMIHEGERIFPKADNEELMKSIKGNNNADLVNEIRRLNEKVASLERTVAQGAAVNAQATDRNTEAVVQAVTSSTDRTIQSNSIKERATLK